MKTRGRQEPEREALFVSNVKVPEHRARGLDTAAVARLAESMAQIGLQTPITVRDDGEWPVLVAGLHRLKAAERLGWDKIEAIYLEGDDRDARLTVASWAASPPAPSGSPSRARRISSSVATARPTTPTC